MNLFRFFFGISATFLAGVIIFLIMPFVHLSTLEPVQDEDLGIWVPVPPHGLAAAGKEVYVEQGCVYCHTQVVSAPGFSPDVERGWGPRVTVPLDYFYEKHSLIGLRRFGPDLAFAGWEGRETRAGGPLTEEYLYTLLYDPTTIDPRIRKPSYNFLFEHVKVDGPVPNNAIEVSAESAYAPRPGYVVVPKREAQELVAYILSLNPNYALPGAPLEAAEEEEAPADENAEAAATEEGAATAETDAEPADDTEEPSPANDAPGGVETGAMDSPDEPTDVEENSVEGSVDPDV